MRQKLIITESDKEHIRKLYKLKEDKKLEVFPIDGGYNIGYDKNWDNFSNPRSTANSDFSKKSTHAGAGGHPKGHFGIDIFGKRGTPILAPVDGVVKLDFGNGNTVIIKDKDGYSHWLGHLDSILVKNGQSVNSGTKVGTLGDTGNAKGTAPHLHYNVYRTSGGFYSAEDPLDDLKNAIGKGSSKVMNNDKPKQKDKETESDVDLINDLKKVYNKKETFEKKQKPYPVEKSVELLQTALQFLGFSLPKWGVDGKFGPETKKATTDFQEKHSLDVTGIVDQKTMGKIIKKMDESDFENKDIDKIQKNKVESLDDVDVNTGDLKDFKFAKIPGGQNNWRSAQITADILPSVIKKYGIKNIIRMSGDDEKHRSKHTKTSKDTEKKICEENGCTYHYIDSHSGYKLGKGYTKSIQKTSEVLNKGNTLIHCAHGADRTGGMVGAYLKNNGYMKDKDELWKYTTQFNSWQNLINGNNFFGSGYDKYADGFYPISELKNSKWVK